MQLFLNEQFSRINFSDLFETLTSLKRMTSKFAFYSTNAR